MINKLQIYKASAGSGKTFLLTQNFLKLVFENPDNFSKILAVTFTNKAAEEMKTRIVSEINAIINDGQKADHFQSISKLLNISEQEIIDKAKLIRTKILHNYSSFYVSTIDSFVQKIIKAFTYEINVSSNYKLELDQDAAANELTKMLYLLISENRDLQNWLIQFAMDKINEGKAWDFKNDLTELAKEIFKEKYQSLKQFNYIDKVDISKINLKLKDFLVVLKKIITDFEQNMEELSVKVETILKNSGFNYDDQGLKFKTISNYFLKKIKEKKYEFDTEGIKNATQGFEFWHNKNPKKEILDNINSVYPQMLELVLTAEKLLAEEYIKYNSAKFIIKNYYSFGILKDISALLPQYRNDNNLLLISDTTLLLKEIIGNNDAPFIYEKMGNRFKNILFDEFQDTSSFQWSIFKPLIENSLSENYSNLIVGDIKQSIYRWRGGDWKLLLSGVKENINPEQLSEETLETNWRSRKNIVEFNNTFFLHAPKILQDSYNLELFEIENKEILNKLKEEKFDSTLTDAYNNNYQKYVEKPAKLGGKVNIKFLPKKPEIYKGEIAELVPKQIDELIKSGVYKAGQITILCRKRNEIKEISHILLDYIENTPGAVSYPIISSDSLYIGSSPAVKIIINALKYIADERDNIALSALRYEFNKISKNKNTDFHKIFATENQKFGLPEEFFSKKEHFKRKSLYEITENLITIFELDLKDREFPYIRAFQDIVIAYTGKENSDLLEFLTWWNEKGSTKSIEISEEQNAVRIMTVHKSKGLDFDIVIIPYTTWPNDTSNKGYMWAKAEISPFSDFEYYPVVKTSSLSKTIFQKDFFDEKLYNYMDSINMLYVAFTRAVNELYIYSTIYEENNKSEIKSIGDLLYKTVSDRIEHNYDDKRDYIKLNNYFDEKENTFILDTEHSKYYLEKGKKTEKENIQTVSLNFYPNYDWTQKLAIHRESDDFYIESIEEIHEKVNYGTMMHKIISQIITLEDIEKETDEIFFAGYITLEQKKELIEKIKEIINRENVKPWFRKNIEVITEKAIIDQNGDLKIPDRIIIEKELITVIDFKFGKEQTEHISQITEYKNLLQKMYSTKILGTIYYAETDKIVNI